MTLLFCGHRAWCSCEQSIHSEVFLTERAKNEQAQGQVRRWGAEECRCNIDVFRSHCLLGRYTLPGGSGKEYLLGSIGY
jgi:hypothetical protein